MNILDENIMIDQRIALQTRGIAIHQIGFDVGRKGMKDEELIPFLHSLRDSSFFTRDRDFDERKFCHPRYCLVFLTIKRNDVAEFVRRVLHHTATDTKAKRMGSVLRVSYEGMRIWKRNADSAVYIRW
ncbi:MAG: hypothetical protein HY741_13190 [Chloroflexi bacterium]|nr:hypothetical protein [Chloroflexota bacterium]